MTLIGANGAGKTTTLKTISGLLHPRQGSGHCFEGKDVSKTAAHHLVRQGIGHAPEGRRIFSRMTVLENLQMGAFTRDQKTIRADIDRVYDLFPRLKERERQKGGTLSGGEQQMLAIGRALMSEPRLLARRALARPRADPRPAGLRHDQGDQRPGHDRAARRAERACRRSRSPTEPTCSRPAGWS